MKKAKVGDGFVVVIATHTQRLKSRWQVGQVVEVTEAHDKWVRLTDEWGDYAHFTNPPGSGELPFMRPETPEERTMRLLRKGALS